MRLNHICDLLQVEKKIGAQGKAKGQALFMGEGECRPTSDAPSNVIIGKILNSRIVKIN